MTRSRGRITRLAVGVIAAAIGMVLMMVGAPAASASGTGTYADPYVQNGNVDICHATASATNPYVSEAPDFASIVNGTAHGDHQDEEDIIPSFWYKVGDGAAQQYPGRNWNAAGQAMWNNGCTTAQTTSQNPPATVTQTATVTKTETATVTATVTVAGTTQTVMVPTTVTATVTQTAPGVTVTIGGENRTVTSQAVQTVTHPVTRTVTNQVIVAGESSEIPSTPAGSATITVMGESSSIGAAPSANAHTGQGSGILPYLLFGGGVLLMVTGLRVRRGHAHQ